MTREKGGRRGASLAALLMLVGCSRATYPVFDASAFEEHVDSADLGQPIEKRRVTPREAPTLEGAARGALEIYVFDVGQADSVLVVGPPPGRKTLLIDLGEAKGEGADSFVDVAQRIIDITGKETLDYFLISHFHADHLGTKRGGISGLLNEMENDFRVGTFIDLGDEGSEYLGATRGTKQTIEDNMPGWLQSGKVGARVVPQLGSGQIALGAGVTVDIVTFGGRAAGRGRSAFEDVVDYNPSQYIDAPGSENDISIGLEISYGDFEYFTAGDLTGYAPPDWVDLGVDMPPLFTNRKFPGRRETYTNVESMLVTAWEEIRREADVEIYRANHHGSRYSSVPEFLDALDPEVVIYSCGGDSGEGYGHPDADVIRRVGGVAKKQFTTGSVATKSRAAFKKARGTTLGEIKISVNKAGTAYSISGADDYVEEFHAFTDAQERANADQ